MQVIAILACAPLVLIGTWLISRIFKLGIVQSVLCMAVFLFLAVLTAVIVALVTGAFRPSPHP